MFRVSCIQLKSNNNILHNLKKTEKLILKAVKQKSDFILTPEISSLFSLEKKKLLKIYNLVKMLFLTLIGKEHNKLRNKS